MLAPRQERPEVIARLAATFAERGRVRVAPVFREARAVELLKALRGSEHRVEQRVDPETGFQRWRFAWEPGTGCDHPLCELGRWLRGDALSWVSGIAGRALAPKPAPWLVSDRARKAAFEDPFAPDPAIDGDAVGFLIHLTPASWPAEWGGHLEALGARGGPLTDRFSPAWNALDLYELTNVPWRRLPLTDRHVEGYMIRGGFSGNGS